MSVSKEHNDIDYCVLKGVAEGNTPEDILSQYNLHHYPKITIASITRSMNRNKEKIDEIKKQIKERSITNAMEHGIANERVRLERMDELYRVSTTLLTDEQPSIRLKAVDTSLSCLREARAEVKGEGSTTQNYLQFNQFNNLSNEELILKKREIEKKIVEMSRKGDGSYAGNQRDVSGVVQLSDK